MKKTISDGSEQALVPRPASSTEIAAYVDPALVEREVSLLRDECARLLRELEQRYEKARQLPREARARAGRLYDALVSLERALARMLRERAVELFVGALFVGALVALAPSERRRRWRLRHRPRWVTRLLT